MAARNSSKVSGYRSSRLTHAHGIGLWLGQQGAKQAPGSDDFMVVVFAFLFEIFECVGRAGGHSCTSSKMTRVSPGRIFSPAIMESSSDDPLGFLFVSENGFQLIFLVKVQVNIVFIAVLAKLFHELRFFPT